MSRDKTEYKLKRSFDYSSRGERKNAGVLVLQEPDYSNPENYYKLQDMIAIAQSKLLTLINNEQLEEMQEQPGFVPEQKKFHEIDRESELEEQIEGLRMGLRLAEKTNDFMKIFKKMIIKSRGRNPVMVDGQEPMTEPMFIKLHPRDAEGMALRWAGFFILVSDEDGQKSSEKVFDSATTPKEL